MDDLFTSALDERLRRRAPLAARLRPRSLDEVVGQRHLLGPGRPLRALVENDRVGSIILWGPPGTGKTTIANLVASASAREFVPLSAVSAGVKDLRDAVESARRRLAEHDRGTLLFVDEVHRFDKRQQDALLPAVEEGIVSMIGATTENPFFEVNAPLMSRSTLFRLEALSSDDLSTLVERGLEAEQSSATPDALDRLLSRIDGDARALLTTLEVAVAVAQNRGPDESVTAEDIDAARSARTLRHNEDDHFDIASALIKSIRGSDPDAGLYWLARLLEAGDDARFVARRLVILASEDVGMADPTALIVAEAAARAVDHVGLPEAALNLAQAVVHLAAAPKSNRVALGLWAAQEEVRSGPQGAVPPALRDGHYAGASKIGHGTGYQYPHDDPSGFVAQQYLPDHLQGRRYYEPSLHGREARVAELLEDLRKRSSDGR
jgi:putative ATPase